MKLQFKKYNYTIPVRFLTAVLYNDFDLAPIPNRQETDYDDLNNFINSIPRPYDGYFSLTGTESYYSTFNDINGELGEVIDVAFFQKVQ